MSNVVSLTDRRPVRSGVVCTDLGLRFPQVFRVTVHPEALSDPAARRLIGPYPRVTYTLGRPLADIASLMRPGCRSEAIDRLDPEVDWLAVTIRHHADEARALAYLDAVTDAGLPETNAEVIHVDDEVYTILRHTCPQAGQPPHTLAFMASVDDGEAGKVWQHFVPR